MGHGGTLDPMATGVLILGLGAGTKELGHFSTGCTKQYETVVLFGAATDTYDTEGKVMARKSYDHITKEMVETALGKFRGEGTQIPPIFSALRVQGKRLYEYAREGIPLPEGFEIKERPVDVTELEMLEWYPGGSHQWHWPTTEADSAEKKLANQALHIGADVSSPEPEVSATVEETEGKRKREDEVEAEAAEPSSKRSKADAEIMNDTAGAETKASTIHRLSTAAGVIPETETAEPPKDSAKAPTAPPPEADPSPEQPPTRPACAAPAVRLRMTVTSGFYVRSLCHDLGAAVDSLAIMAELTRTRQSNFDLASNVLQYEELQQGEEVWGPKVQKLLEDWNEKKAEREDQQ